MGVGLGNSMGTIRGSHYWGSLKILLNVPLEVRIIIFNYFFINMSIYNINLISIY